MDGQQKWNRKRKSTPYTYGLDLSCCIAEAFVFNDMHNPHKVLMFIMVKRKRSRQMSSYAELLRKIIPLVNMSYYILRNLS